jgi:hypothetical protein
MLRTKKKPEHYPYRDYPDDLVEAITTCWTQASGWIHEGARVRRDSAVVRELPQSFRYPARQLNKEINDGK